MNKEYSGYGYHGGGRPPKKPSERTVYKNLTISGKVEEIEAVKEKAAAAKKSIARYVLDIILKK